jgi:hypothetical protein
MSFLAKSILEADALLGIKCSQLAYRMWQGGNQWSSWESFLTFFRYIAKLNIDYTKYDAWEQLALHSGPRVVHPEFCIISDRPDTLLVDDQNRPHCETGPFCRWRDGTALYAVHGVRIPVYVIDNPQRITITAIDSEKNAEVRRVMIDRYKLFEDVSGAAAYIRDAGGRRVDHDERYGTLWRREVSDDEAILMIEVVNSTPEQDGKFKRYWLRVPPETRTAQEAVAWTFGVNASDYAPQIET